MRCADLPFSDRDCLVLRFSIGTGLALATLLCEWGTTLLCEHLLGPLGGPASEVESASAPAACHFVREHQRGLLPCRQAGVPSAKGERQRGLLPCRQAGLSTCSHGVPAFAHFAAAPAFCQQLECQPVCMC